MYLEKKYSLYIWKIKQNTKIRRKGKIRISGRVSSWYTSLPLCFGGGGGVKYITGLPKM